MNKRNYLTRDQALNIVLNDAGIVNAGSRCLLNRYADGFYEIVVCIPSLKYEAYVDAETGELLGLNTEPLPYPEMLSSCIREEDEPPFAA